MNIHDDPHIIWVDGVSYQKLDGENDAQARARLARIKADQDAMHGPGWRDNYIARKHREAGTLN